MHHFFIVILILVSIVGITFIIERGLALRWRKVIPSAVESAADNCSSERDLPMLVQICEQNPSPISRLLLAAHHHRTWPRQDTVDALQVRARHEIIRLERGLVILEIIVGIAPLLGLVGTIYGLILLFGALGQEGLTDNTALSTGIALALRATLLGLMAAIPALVAWSYYNKKVETLAVEMETLCDEFIRWLYRQPTKTPAPKS
jgi:biopolymer transport protein ExbB